MFRKAANLSDNERIVRLAFGTALLLVSWSWGTDLSRTVVLIMGVLGIVTGIAKYDPLYDLLNINHKKVHHHTVKKSKRSRRH